MRKLADGGGFPSAIHARQHDDKRLVRMRIERLRQWLKQSDERFLQRTLELRCIGKAVTFDFSAQFIKQPAGRIHAGIGGEQYGFQLLIERFVYPAAAEQAGNAFAQVIAGYGIGPTSPLPSNWTRARRRLCRAIFGFEETWHSGRLSYVSKFMRWISSTAILFAILFRLPGL